MNSINSLLSAISSSMLIAAPTEQRGAAGASAARQDESQQSGESAGVLGDHGDSVEISAQARAMAEAEPGATGELGTGKKANGEPLSEEERDQVAELRKRDAEVRQHEQAHHAAAGPYAKGGPSFTYQNGPDGKRYAIGGEVQIDTAAVAGDPEATIAKMQVVRRAALAPGEPSDQDRKVAAAAQQKEQEARAELTARRGEGAGGADEGDGAAGAAGVTREVGVAANGVEAESGGEGETGIDGFIALLREAAVGAYRTGAYESERAVDLVA